VIETRILVAEDEAPQRDALLALLAELWPQARVVAACADGLEAASALEREQPHVAFLDIQMPGASGLDLAASFSGRAHVVFVTAHDEYAVRAFEHGAVDYLLKPVRRERLSETVSRVKARLGERPAALVELLGQLRRDLEASTQHEPLKWITASYGETVKLYTLDEVLVFHAQDKYTRVLTATDDALIRKSLRELLQRLPPDEFWQVHRSVVVRAAAIESVTRDALGKHWLKLKGRTDTLPVSASFHARFRGL